jgi:hypothetical protein
MTSAAKSLKEEQGGNCLQTLLLTDAVPNGLGGFSLKPKRPLREIDSKTTALILGISRSSLTNLVNQKLAKKILVWRWTSPARGKRVFELGSVVEYRKASLDPEFGAKVRVRANR